MKKLLTFGRSLMCKKLPKIVILLKREWDQKFSAKSLVILFSFLKSLESSSRCKEQIDSAILKLRRSIHALKTLRKYFTESEMLQQVTSNVYSKLYYGSLVWLIPNLKEKLFSKLFSHSGQILKIINNNLSYVELHKKFVRATPRIFSLYQTAINFYNTKNTTPCNHIAKINSVTLSVRQKKYKIVLRQK